jgi:hypothetical protein
LIALYGSEGEHMKMLVVGAVGMLALQVLLVWGYLAVSEEDPIVLDPARGGLVENGFMMTAFCGDSSGKEMLEELPANGRWDTWSRGRTVRVSGASCTVWYHHHPGHSPCVHPGYTFERPCPERKRVYGD